MKTLKTFAAGAAVAAVFMVTLLVAGCGGSATAASGPVAEPGTLALASASTTVSQSAGSITITVNRTGGSSGAVAVSYATANGTAIAGTNYTAETGSLIWADGDASAKIITVPVAASPLFYGSATFTLTLSAAADGASLGTATETVTISGSGPAPVPGALALASSAVTGAQAAGSIAITVNRTGGSSGAVTVSYATADGTAVAGTNYTATTGTLSWANGDASAKSVSVSVASSPGFAGSETFTIALSGPTGGATLGTATETVTLTGSLIPPSNFFNLSGVKLQLPIDQYGGTGGVNNIQYAEAEVTSAQLVAGFADPYFYADTSGRMVFMAPSNGAVSTPGSGSDHTRSELRELYAGPGADSNNNWNSAIGGTLTASCIVQAVSVDSDEATIAQIHNESYVFLLLLYRPAYNDVAVSIYSSLGSSTQARTSIVQNVKLGDTINYTLKYVGNTFTVTVDGTTQSFAIDPSWAGTPVYFKLGAYSAAPNIGNPAGDATQVAFSSFSITH